RRRTSSGAGASPLEAEGQARSPASGLSASGPALARDTGEPRALLPEASGRAVVLRRGRRERRSASLEVETARALHLRRGGEVDCGHRPLFLRDGEEALGDRQGDAEHAVIVVAEARSDEARMEAVRRNAGAVETTRELAGEEDIAELRALVRGPAAVVSRALKVVEVEC